MNQLPVLVLGTTPVCRPLGSGPTPPGVALLGCALYRQAPATVGHTAGLLPGSDDCMVAAWWLHDGCMMAA